MNINGRSALIAVDLQQGVLGMLDQPDRQQLITKNTELADAFHSADLPVIWVHATGLPTGITQHPMPEPEELPDNFVDLDTELPDTEGDIHVNKPRTWSAFVRTDLTQRLRELKVDTVVISGIATGAGVESTARSAYDEGFNVIAASDAMADGNPSRHEQALAEDFPSIGQVATAAEIIAAVIALHN